MDTAYGSAGKTFWRGFMWGLGRGIGNIIGFLALLAVLYFLFKVSGLDESFRAATQDFKKLLETLPAIRR